MGTESRSERRARRQERRARVRLTSLSWVALTALACPLSLEPIPEISRFEFDLATVRSLGAGTRDSLPRHVEVFIAGETWKPAAAVFGGVRFDLVSFIYSSFKVVYPNRFVLVDAPPGSPEVHEALSLAEQIVVTHEHPDHIGGILEAPGASEWSHRLFLTREQSDALDREDLTPRLAFARYHALSPGVVLIRAAGHTPGSQIVYVRLQSGRELLLVGDIAWHRSQFEQPAGRPWISSWIMAEDRRAVGHQLRRLHELRREASLDIVVSHDKEQLAAYVESGSLVAAAAPR